MRQYLRWLLPGLGLKRWLILCSLGIFLMGLSISVAVSMDLYAPVGIFLFENISKTVGMFMYGPLVVGILGVLLGLAVTIGGITRLVRSVLQTVTVPSGAMAETYYLRRNLLRGPRVVAVGGGTGIPTLLRGMKEYTSRLTAVVTMADDGGSSGRLRTEFGILPPGDIRNCIVALADTEPLMERLFQHRFQEGTGLSGHTFGNLLILAMTETTGNFYEAIQTSSQVLAIRGQVLPSTLNHVRLRAVLENGDTLIGESQIGKSPNPIRRIFLETLPESGDQNVEPLPDALRALEEADVIVLGPGSLYTSIIPNLLVPGVVEAIRRSRALKIYVCNIMTEPGETEGYSVSDHLEALISHAGYGIIDTCIVNSEPIPEHLTSRYQERRAFAVAVDAVESQRYGADLVQVNLLDDDGELVRHDPQKLSWHIGRLFLDRRRHLERTPWDFFLLRQRLQEKERREASI